MSAAERAAYDAALHELQRDSAADVARLLILGPQWGGALSPSQYAARDAHINAHSAWVRGGALSVYALKVPGDSEDECASSYCEGYQMRGLRCVAPGELVPCTVLGIASVFTPAQRRGRGYASRMLSALARRVAAADSPPAALMLMCEIEPTIYERLGYVAPTRPVHDWAFTHAGSRDAAPPAVLGHEAQPLLPADVPAYVARMETLVRRDMLRRGVVGAVVVTPTAEQCMWPSDRYDAVRAVSAAAPPPAAACGARCGDAWALWAMDLEENQGTYTPVLRITLLCAGADDDTAAVLAAAVDSARAAGASAGRAIAWQPGTLLADGRAADGAPFWAPPAAALARAGIAAALEPRRCRSTPMMAPLAEAVRPEAWVWAPRAIWI